MAYDGLNKYMDTAAEIAKNLASNTRFTLSMEMSRVTRDGTAESRIARPSSQARTGTGKCSFSPFCWPRAGLATLPASPLLVLVSIICGYHISYSKSKDQTGEVPNPARGQLDRKNEYFPVLVRA